MVSPPRVAPGKSRPAQDRCATVQRAMVRFSAWRRGDGGLRNRDGPAAWGCPALAVAPDRGAGAGEGNRTRSEEHTSELQSLMRLSYAGFCLKKTKRSHDNNSHVHHIQH